MEVWKDVVGYEGYYQVSNEGRIKSLERLVTVRKDDQPYRLKKEQIMVAKINKRGYIQICLCVNRKRILKRTHRLVMEAFVPNPENNPSINHINGIKTDNRLENLTWCTHSENIQHAFDVGLKSHLGEKNTRSKLTNIKVLKIRDMYPRMTYKEIAKVFNVHRDTIYDVVNRRRWKHI